MGPRVINPARKQHRVSFALHDANNLIILIIMPFLYTLFVIDNPEDDHMNIYDYCSNSQAYSTTIKKPQTENRPCSGYTSSNRRNDEKRTFQRISKIYNC